MKIKSKKILSVHYLNDINEAKPGQYKQAIIVQKEIEEGCGMYCPMCLSKVNMLSNTEKGEACYQCREKYDLNDIGYPKSYSQIKVNKKKFYLNQHDKL